MTGHIDMQFENLRVSRIAVHEIYQRADDHSIKDPTYSEELEVLSPEAMGAFRLRMTDALSGGSQSIEMRIAKYDDESYLAFAEPLINSTNDVFLQGTKRIAYKLADSQKYRRIPGGMVIIFDGTVGATSTPYIGVIKAETQAGFRRSLDGERTIVEFLKNIFLTPATRLYKIGIFLFDGMQGPRPVGRRAFVFDSNITSGNREAAAAYFYEGFLGCALPSDGAYETAKFFDLTKAFVRSSDLAPEKKRELIDSLFVFVRDEQDPTFTSDQFCDRYLPAELRDNYSTYMLSKKFTANAVVRDLGGMGNKLRRRKLNFGGDIQLSASPEALAEKVIISAVDGKLEDGSVQSWTQILVKEQLSGEQ